MEEWRDVKDFDNYMISNKGRVKSKERISIAKGTNYIRKEKILHYGIHKLGYLYVYLYNNNGNNKKKMYIHRLVANAFIENTNDYKEINHIDGDKQNNCVENLEWCNRSMNVKHAYQNNLEKKLIGKLNHKSKAIKQFTKDGEFIRNWESINLANKSLNITSVGSCCRGDNKTAGGYIWRYAND